MMKGEIERQKVYEWNFQIQDMYDLIPPEVIGAGIKICRGHRCAKENLHRP